MISIRAVLSFALSVGLLAMAARALAEQRTLPLGDGAQLHIDLPEGWELSWRGHGQGGTAELSQPATTTAHLLATVLPLLPTESTLNLAELRAMVQRQGLAQLPTATQQRLDLIRVPLSEGGGYLYHLTDRQAESGPGDFQEMHQGALLSNGYLLTVTLLSHPDDTDFVVAGLRALVTIRVSHP